MKVMEQLVCKRFAPDRLPSTSLGHAIDHVPCWDMRNAIDACDK
jgi:hypothetical protein